MQVILQVNLGAVHGGNQSKVMYVIVHLFAFIYGNRKAHKKLAVFGKALRLMVQKYSCDTPAAHAAAAHPALKT